MRKIPPASVAVFVLLLASQAFASTIVTNGGFETGNFSGWSVTGYDSPCSPNDQYCGVSSATDPNYPIQVYDGTYSAYLGPVGAVTNVSQTLPLAPSTSYTLTFSLDEYISPDPTNDYTNSFGVSANGTSLVSDSNISDTGGYQSYLLTFSTAASGNSDLLQFAFQNDIGYFYVDDVSVVASSFSSAPEPGSLMLLVAGLGLLGVVRGAGRGPTPQSSRAVADEKDSKT